ncbi:MAG: hypothetical protein KF729_18870 [Sandaracinaceae bacterium]|nr:hypothetical protein [Sandaracinaceae bacterium]
MRIRGKLLSLDAAIVSATIADEQLVVEGLVEGMVAVRLELGRDDLAPLARAIGRALRARFAERGPPALVRALGLAPTPATPR